MTFDELCRGFYAECKKHRDFGTMDTEPQCIFESLIRKALKGKEVEIPTTAEGWEIYDKEGSDIVAASMAEAAHPCVQMAKQASEIYQFALD